MNFTKYNKYEPNNYEKDAAHKLVYNMGYDNAYVKLQNYNQSINISVKKGKNEFSIWCRTIKKNVNNNYIPEIFGKCISLLGEKCFTLTSLSDFITKNGYKILKMKVTSDKVIQGIILDNSIKFDFKFISNTYNTEYINKKSANQQKQTFPIIEDFDDMDGHDFEYFCAELLKKNGFKDVFVTNRSSDQGVDIIAEKESVKFGIQCKCHSQDIGNKAVQEVYAGKTFYKCHVGIVLTNRYFTKSAKELAENNGVILWDRDKLISLASIKNK